MFFKDYLLKLDPEFQLYDFLQAICKIIININKNEIKKLIANIPTAPVKHLFPPKDIAHIAKIKLMNVNTICIIKL